MAQSIRPYLMFQNQDAEDAMNFYVANLAQAQITSIQRWGEDDPGPNGGVKFGCFELCGREFIAIDSPAAHDFDFTPSNSLFVDCENETQLDSLYSKLSEGGAELMPLQDWGFSKKFGWINDRFGVSWQLNLPFGEKQ